MVAHRAGDERGDDVDIAKGEDAGTRAARVTHAGRALEGDQHAALGDLLGRTGLLTKDRLDAVERESAKSAEPFQRLLVERAGVSAEQVQQIQELLNKETIFGLLRWRSGSFHFRPQTVQTPHESVRLLPAEEILMDGLRMLDEWRTLDADATDPDAVFRQSGELDVYDEWAAGDPPERKAAAARLFRAVDGHRSVRRLADFSREGTFETARLLTGLRRAGVIDVVDPSSLLRVRARGGVSELALQGATRVGALAPFLLLAVFAFLIARPPAAEPSHGPIVLDRDPAQAARSAFVTARLRNLSEVHRLATGQWPGSAEELVRKGWIEADALAAAGSGPYHWHHDGEDLFVLAPER